MSESFGRHRRELSAGPFRVSDTWHAPGLELPPHEHVHACLHFVLAGNYRESAAGRWDEHGPDSVLYKPAGFRHANRFDAAGARTLRIELEPEPFDGSLPLAQQRLAARAPELALIGRRIEREFAREDDVTPLALEGLALELIATLLRAPERAPSRIRVEECAALLRERFQKRWSAGDLALELGCERTGLARAFRRRFGVTMGAYVRTLRVAEVMRLLQRGVPLSAAALEAGFADQSHCTRVFRRATGSTPSAWLRR